MPSSSQEALPGSATGPTNACGALDPGAEPIAVTEEPPQARADRWADGAIAPDGSIVVVREHHPAGGRPADVVNTLVRLRPDGGSPEVLRSGADFVASPRPSWKGEYLAWIEWDHPNMPWDATRLFVRTSDGNEHVVAGEPGESVVQPGWLPDGSLGFVSDRSGGGTSTAGHRAVPSSRCSCPMVS